MSSIRYPVSCGAYLSFPFISYWSPYKNRDTNQLYSHDDDS